MTQDGPNLTDEARAEIAAAVQIVASDQQAKRLRAIHEHLIPPTPETEPPKDGDPTPPPKNDPPAEPPAQKRGLWWGDALQDADL